MTTPPSYLNIAGRCSPPLTVTMYEKKNKAKKQDVKLFCPLAFVRDWDLRNFQQWLLCFTRSQLCLMSDLTTPSVPKEYGKSCSCQITCAWLRSAQVIDLLVSQDSDPAAPTVSLTQRFPSFERKQADGLLPTFRPEICWSAEEF